MCGGQPHVFGGSRPCRRRAGLDSETVSSPRLERRTRFLAATRARACGPGAGRRRGVSNDLADTRSDCTRGIAALGIFCAMRYPTWILEQVARNAAITKPAGLFAISAITVLGVIGTMFPSLIGPRSMCWWYQAFMLMFCVMMSPFGTEMARGMLFYRSTVWAASVCIGFVCIKFRVLLVWNMLLALTFVWLYASDANGVGDITVRDIFSSELVALCLKLAFFWVLESLLIANVRDDVKLRRDLCQRCAVASSVHLGGQLRGSSIGDQSGGRKQDPKSEGEWSAKFGVPPRMLLLALSWSKHLPRLRK